MYITIVTPLLLDAEFWSYLEGKLTAGYSETYSEGQTSGVTVTAEPGQHATVTWGGCCSSNIGHHAYVQLQHSLFCVVIAKPLPGTLACCQGRTLDH